MTIEIIKADLPNMPDEVIESWLITHFKRFGWPPKLDNEWRFILRKGNDLVYLQRLKWKKVELILKPDLFAPVDLGIIKGLYLAHVRKTPNLYSASMPDGFDRFNACCNYLKEHGRFPKPVVLEKRPEGFWILDGNHRTTAYLYLYGYFQFENPEVPSLIVQDEQPVWLATS